MMRKRAAIVVDETNSPSIVVAAKKHERQTMVCDRYKRVNTFFGPHSGQHASKRAKFVEAKTTIYTQLKATATATTNNALIKHM